MISHPPVSYSREGFPRADPVTVDGMLGVVVASSQLITVACGGGISRDSGPVTWDAHEEVRADDGVTVISRGSGLVVRTRIEMAAGSVTFTVSMGNETKTLLSLGNWQPLGLELSGQPVDLRGFTSGWGLEYEPVQLSVETEQTVKLTTGRSSHGHSPLFLATFEEGAYVLAPHWSGNWQIETKPVEQGLLATIGFSPDGSLLTLMAGQLLTLPAVTVGYGTTPTNAAAGLVARILRRSPAGPPLLTEWNHWWPYEDREINEDAFLANATIAGELGLDVAVLDAGWFGGTDINSDWVAERGDWHKINSARFPHGLAWLAEQTRQRGIDFGIWIEPEAVGAQADLQRLHPDFLATSTRAKVDGSENLGYVCLGSPAAAQFMAETVRGLIQTTKARWLKWDFNVDPQLGCDRSDHGHHSGEGLLRHYQGLYALLDDLRAEFPHTVFEACSSGGLRIDLGLAEHVDCLFLSDPDWTEHHLACLWGACQMLPPRQILHWMESEWRSEHRFQKADYSADLITPEEFDTKVQAAMLHRFGVSARLTEMRPDLLERLRWHIEIYKSRLRPLLADGVLSPLTEQPLRDGKGNRTPAFQLSAGDDHLVAAFRLPPATSWNVVQPRALDAHGSYTVAVLDLDGYEFEAQGQTLMAEGIPLPAGSSTLVLLTKLR